MLKSQKGYSLLLTICCIMIFAVLGISLMTLTANGIKKNETRDTNIQAETLATKGLDYIIAAINYDAGLKLAETETEYQNYLKAKAAAESAKQNFTDTFDFEAVFSAKFNNVLITKYGCKNDGSGQLANSTLDGNNNYEYCVKIKKVGTQYVFEKEPENFPHDTAESWYTVNEDDKGIRKILTLKSKGHAENTDKTLYSRVMVGLNVEGETVDGGEEEGDGDDNKDNKGDKEAVYLKYALSTFEGISETDSTYLNAYKNKTGNENPKENGSVFFHGGVDIIGPMYVQNNLYVSQFGKPSYGDYDFSSYPRIMTYSEKFPGDGDYSLAKTKPGTITLGDGVNGKRNMNKIYNWKKESDVNSKYNYPSSLDSNHKKYLANPLGTSLSYTFGQTKETKLMTDFYDVSNRVDGQQVSVLSKGIGNSGTVVQKLAAQGANEGNPFASHVDLDTIKQKIISVTGTVNKNCSNRNTTQEIIYCTTGQSYGSINITLNKVANTKTSDDISVRKGVAFYNGNLSFNSCTSTLKGTFFVNGNLSINSCTIKADAVFYVTGEVDIEGSNIHSEGTTGTLIIFADKNIRLQRISAGSPTPSNLKGYFLTNSDIAITGSNSHVLINGGISARSIELTAMRGPSTSWDGKCSSATNISSCVDIEKLHSYWISTPAQQANIEKQMRSRLTIAYNSDVEITYKENAVKKEEIKYALLTTAEKDRALK